MFKKLTIKVKSKSKMYGNAEDNSHNNGLVVCGGANSIEQAPHGQCPLVVNTHNLHDSRQVVRTHSWTHKLTMFKLHLDITAVSTDCQCVLCKAVSTPCQSLPHLGLLCLKGRLDDPPLNRHSHHRHRQAHGPRCCREACPLQYNATLRRRCHRSDCCRVLCSSITCHARFSAASTVR